MSTVKWSTGTILYQLIGDAITKAGIKPKAVNSAVSGRSVIVRRIPMEKMTEAQARQAIHWEAEQHILQGGRGQH
ncbi:MAG: hypothetical protein MZV49_23665 [Rhodopseudomonas palustris]|nr:hypothetical protein [Rhodopseudomonas palustris]